MTELQSSYQNDATQDWGIEFGALSAKIVEPHKFDYDVALQVISHFRAVHTGAQWVIGDILNAAEEHLGEAYSQLEEELKYSRSYLKDLKYVAKTYPPEARRDGVLTWSHHRLVAPDKDRLGKLEMAEKGNMSVGDLQDTIKKHKDHAASMYPKYKKLTVQHDGDGALIKLTQIDRFGNGHPTTVGPTGFIELPLNGEVGLLKIEVVPE